MESVIELPDRERDAQCDNADEAFIDIVSSPEILPGFAPLAWEVLQNCVPWLFPAAEDSHHVMWTYLVKVHHDVYAECWPAQSERLRLCKISLSRSRERLRHCVGARGLLHGREIWELNCRDRK